MLTLQSLTLSMQQLEGMIRHCVAWLPDEGCGLIVAGPASNNCDLYMCKSVMGSPNSYMIDPIDYLKAEQSAQSRGLQIVGTFHSHPSTPAELSESDVRLAPNLSWVYLVLSLANMLDPEVKAWRIHNGHGVEVPVTYCT